MRNYQNQFPADFAPPAELLAALAAGGWVDTSWGNDVSPSFCSPCGRFKLWIDHMDLDQREMGGKRFTVYKTDSLDQCPTDPDYPWKVYATDSVERIIAHVLVRG